MGKIIRLTESDLTRLVKRVIKEQSINETWPFSKKISTKDDEFANSIYRHLEKWDSQHFKNSDSEPYYLPGEFKYTAERNGDKIKLSKSLIDREVYVNGKKLNCSKETFNKLVELFKRKFTEQDSKDSSDIFNRI